MTPARSPLRSGLALLLCLPAFVWTADLLAGTPPLILAGAMAPGALLTCVLLWLQRGGGRSAASLLFSLAWGAVGAAFLSSSANELARAWMDMLAGGDGRAVTAIVAAPALEEAFKAVGLALLLAWAPASFRNARDGIVYGALIGGGFVITENLLYLGVSMLQGGEAGLWRGLYLRGVLGGATHAVFTACAGAGLGWPAAGKTNDSGASRYVHFAAMAGFLAALGQHMAWNGLAAPMISTALCGAEAAGQACKTMPTDAAVYGQSSAVALLFLAPGICGLIAVWRNRRSCQDR